ncbi:LytTr DNA-binding domain-containing protein [Roseivivax lentus]|uniref:LytTr DNA-binding domain-containing protein n=1 Tax=Roseivivax lentus TaxID=633194 RepID=A0A1N7KXC7_9RHOB|nr:LytTr DNA-binding domain-containing protein [Roseivivax lentus]
MFHEKEFWRHHATVFAVAFLILTLSRAIGAFDDLASIRTLALQSTIMIAVALPLQTAGALLGTRYCGGRCTTRTASLIGCILAAIPSTALAMILIWISGLMSLEGGAEATRADFIAWMRSTYPAAVILHASLGSMLWMVLSYPWWDEKIETAAAGIPRIPTPAPEGARDEMRRHADAWSPPEFLRRLSPENSGTLWALSSERHYVRVRTDTGSELLLMRLSDAMDQCRHLDGVQLHRSHWINRPGLDRVVRRSGKLEVVLANGESLPVSRSHQADVLAFVQGDVSHE